VPRGKNSPPLLGVAHTGSFATMLRVHAAAHFDNDVGAVRRMHDGVIFSATMPGRPIIARNQPQALALQIAQRFIFGGIAALFGGAQWHRF
jgi:hypothetical protein